MKVKTEPVHKITGRETYYYCYCDCGELCNMSSLWGRRPQGNCRFRDPYKCNIKSHLARVCKSIKPSCRRERTSDKVVHNRFDGLMRSQMTTCTYPVGTVQYHMGRVPPIKIQITVDVCSHESRYRCFSLPYGRSHL